MLYNRRKGILALHGAIVSLIIPAWFILYWFLYARLGPGLILAQTKEDLYAVGLMLASLTFFSYYPRLAYRNKGGAFSGAMEVAGIQTLIIALTFFGIAFAAQEMALSRWFALTYLGSCWVLLSLLNYFLPHWLTTLTLRSGSQVTTMLIGNSFAAERLWGWLKNQEGMGMQIAGLVTEDENDRGLLGVKHLGKVWELEDIFKTQTIDQVILLESMLSPERLRNIFRICQRQGVRILVYSYWEDLLNYPLVAVAEGETTFFTLGEEPLENPVNRFTKRTLDILVSLPVCVLMLPLLMLYIKARQRKESPGPLFFKQLRAGKSGKTFLVYKFRTMHVRENDACDTKQAQVNDPRVYAFGQWMRRTSIDELPQFINVLRGEMSVVGPRPHMLAHDSQFSEYVELYRSRQFVKPGITGLAQVNGFRGEISELNLLEQRVKHDIEYITHWSLWLDIVIIIKTAFQVIKPQKTAY